MVGRHEPTCLPTIKIIFILCFFFVGNMSQPAWWIGFFHPRRAGLCCERVGSPGLLRSLLIRLLSPCLPPLKSRITFFCYSSYQTSKSYSSLVNILLTPQKKLNILRYSFTMYKISLNYSKYEPDRCSRLFSHISLSLLIACCFTVNLTKITS